MSICDFLSPFEELVLTAVQECGHGALDEDIWRKVRDLAGRRWIPFNRVQATLRVLELDGCAYSWGNEIHPQYEQPVLRQYCVRLRGVRALEAALERRGNPVFHYFYRASRFGMLWDAWSVLRSRFLAARRAWNEDAGRDENA